ncbi:venom serine protease Bi-VSP-like [Bombyx mandarina]|uniref:Venom serine protease Bi-VSP-like n=1 Tax=Bombyx mandarina TaxID=7092 RepID=A0A6J2JCY4_BOMMA|nr:venom serine protease Bi-VSP-like [Bombyx mandarina]
MCIYLYYVFFLYLIGNVNTMSLYGPALTRYNPCGLGIIYFDNVKGFDWRAVVDFGLYNNLEKVEMEVYFEKEIKINKASQNTTFVVVRNNWHHIIIRPIGPLQERFTFDLNIRNSSGNDVPVVTKFSINKVILCNDEIKARQKIGSYDITNKYNGGKRYAHVCGRRSLENTELTSVRTEAKAGDWPWHVAILIRQPKSVIGVYNCGGTIISRRAVLTAGHCLFMNGSLVEANNIVVIAGVNNHKDLTQVGRQERLVQKIILHPSYTYTYSTSDLAILKVFTWTFTDYVQPLCIWGPVYEKTKLFGKEAIMVGFGATEKNVQSDILRAANTIVQNDTTCINFDADVYRPLLNEFTFCTGYGPKSAVNPRNGDSGGGLIVRAIQTDHKVTWYLRGVLSKCGISPGHSECDPTYYMVYTDVGPHYGWIYHHSGLHYLMNVVE